MITTTLTEGGPAYYSNDAQGTSGYWRSHERFVKRGTVRVVNGKPSFCFLVDKATWLHGTVFPARCHWGPVKL